MEKSNYNLLNYSDVMLEQPAFFVNQNSAEQQIVVMDKQECVFPKVKNICYVEADGAYSIIYMIDGKKLVVSKNVKVFAEKLAVNFFCRIHKSYLININFVSKYVKSDGGYIIMENGALIPVSVRKKETFMRLVEHLSL